MNTRQALQIGAFRVEPDRNLLAKGDETYSLEPRIMDVLYALATNPGDVLSRDDLIDLVWKVQHGADESLTRAISVIRKTIRSAGEEEQYIETIPRRGYRLAQPVAFIDAPAAKTISVVAMPEAPVAPPATSVPAQTAPSPPEGNGSTSGVSQQILMFAGGLVLVLGAALFWAFGGGATGPKVATNSIVVLPFSNLSGDPEYDYMTTGLSAELRSALMRNEALQVVAQHTSKVVKTSDLDSQGIAEQLGVAFILDGNLTRTDGGLSMSAELINAETGYSQWSKDYIADEGRLLQIQESVVGSIVESVTEDVDNLQAKTQGAPRRAAAFNAYLLGAEAYRSAATPDEAEIALRKFDEAIASDPEFALAHAQRALILSWQSSSSADKNDAAEKLLSALASARTAVQIAPNFAKAQSTLGWVEFFSALNISEAERPFERSLELGTGNAVILSRYAYYAALVGKFDKARDAIDAAIKRDPFNPSTHRIAATVHFYGGDYAASRESIDSAVELGASFIWYWAGLTGLQLEQIEAAISYCEKEEIPALRNSCLGIISARVGDTKSAEEFLNKLGSDAKYQQAQLLAELGRIDDAMFALNDSLKSRDPGLVAVLHDPFLDPLRERSDFSNLLLNLGFIDDLP